MNTEVQAAEAAIRAALSAGPAHDKARAALDFLLALAAAAQPTQKRIGPVIDLQNPGRSRLDVLHDMLMRGEITREQYQAEARAAQKLVVLRGS